MNRTAFDNHINTNHSCDAYFTENPCERPEFPDDSNIQLVPDQSQYNHDESVTFNCETGYSLVGPGELTCQTGTFGTELPSCLGLCYHSFLDINIYIGQNVHF